MAIANHTSQSVRYKDIVGFPGYRAGDDGTIWSLFYRGSRGRMGTTWNLLHHGSNRRRDGYHTVDIYRDKRKFTFLVHRLILETFVGPCPEGMEGCHANDVKSDNRLVNLRWDTPKANSADARKNGKIRVLAGFDNPRARVTIEDIREIRRRVAAGMSCKQIFESMDFSYTTINDIARGARWKDVI